MDIFDLSGQIRIEGVTDAQASLATMSKAAEGATAALTGTEQASTAAGSATAQVAAGFDRVATSAQQASTDSSVAAAAFIELSARLADATRGFTAGTLTQEQYHAALRGIVADTTDLVGSLRLSESEFEGFTGIVAQANAALRGEAAASRQASTTLDVVAAALAKLITLHRTGAITASQYREGLRTLNADLKQLAQTEQLTAAEQTRLNTLLGQTTVRETVRGAQGIGTMRSALFSLSTQALGTTGSIGSLAGGLLQFSAGGEVAVAVAAGLAAIAVGYKLLTTDSDKLHDESQKLADSFFHEAEGADRLATAIKGIDAALTEAERHKANADFWDKLAGLFGHGGPAGGFVAGIGALLQGHADSERDQAGKDHTATAQATKDAIREEMELHAARTQLGIATEFETRQVRAYIDVLWEQAKGLRAAYDGHKLNAEEQRQAGEEAQRLTQTLEQGTKEADKALGAYVQRLADEIGYYKELAALHPLTTEQTEALTGALNAVQAAEAIANLTRRDSITLLKSEKDALALLGGEEAKRAAAVLRANAGGASHFTAPQRPNDGRSLAPFAVPDGIIDTRALIPDAALKQMTADMDKAIAAAAGKATFTETREGFRQSIGRAITDGIVAGFDTALATGDIGAGFGALIGALLSGIGTAMEQFGAAALVASQFMQAIMDSLMALDPSGSAAAAIGMIAMGAVFKALGNAAASAFGGGGSSGGSVGSGGRGAGRSEAETTRIIVQPMGVREASAITPMRPVGPNIFVSPKDPTWQRQLTETIRHADSRKG